MKLRSLVLGFWVLVQLTVPLVREFELPSFRYSPRSFSWTMYTYPRIQYEASFFRRTASGRKEPIPDIERYAPGLRSPDGMPMEAWCPVEWIQDRLVRLIRCVAEHQRDGAMYGVSVRWISAFPRDPPADWECQVRSPSRSAE